LWVPQLPGIDRPGRVRPEGRGGLQLQVLALPWVSRSGFIAHFGIQGVDASRLNEARESRLTELIQGWRSEADPELPTVLTAHASVQGAKYGAERTVMLGADLLLSGSLVRDPRLDYVALGHIHKPQNLNEGAHPPVIYPGSIERIDFGEARDDKFFVIAEVSKGKTKVHWHRLENIRPFFDCHLRLKRQEDVTAQLKSVLPPEEKMPGAIVRLVVESPREWEPLINEAGLREYASQAFEFHLVTRPQSEARVRLPVDKPVGSLSSLELLDLYWRASHIDKSETEELNRLAGKIIAEIHHQTDEDSFA